MTATTEQLLVLLRDAQEFIDHTAICDEVANWSALPPYPSCTCGMRLLMVRVEEALANHPKRPESSTPHPADLLDAHHETLHVEQPAHRTTPIGGDDDGN